MIEFFKTLCKKKDSRSAAGLIESARLPKEGIRVCLKGDPYVCRRTGRNKICVFGEDNEEVGYITFQHKHRDGKRVGERTFRQTKVQGRGLGTLLTSVVESIFKQEGIETAISRIIIFRPEEIEISDDRFVLGSMSKDGIGSLLSNMRSVDLTESMSLAGARRFLTEIEDIRLQAIQSKTRPEKIGYLLYINLKTDLTRHVSEVSLDSKEAMEDLFQNLQLPSVSEFEKQSTTIDSAREGFLVREMVIPLRDETLAGTGKR